MDKYILLLTSKERRLTSSQIKTIVDILVGIGMITFGSVILPAIIDRYSTKLLTFGLGSTLSFWAMAVILSRGA